MEDAISIYIHFPFCKRKCPYCSFYSIETYSDELVNKYFSALKRQWEFFCSEFALEQYRLSSIYIGGGTPSLSDVGYIQELLSLIAKKLPLEGVETTIEVNPGDVAPDRAEAYYALGINRVSLGVQSLSDKRLGYLGRRHNAEEAIRALDILGVHFQNISCDIIYGLPNEDFKDIEYDINLLARFPIKHISMYSLYIEEGSAMFEKGKRGEQSENNHQAYQFIDSLLSAFGFQWYEISNFARGEHYISRHNTGYWLGRPYIGLGPSAWSFVNGKRFGYPNDLRLFVQDGFLDKNSLIYDDTSSGQEEALLGILQLRTKWGIAKSEAVRMGWQPAFETFMQRGWVVLDKNAYVLTLDGRLFADEIAIALV